MNRIYLSLLVCWVLASLLVDQAKSSGLFELRLKHFSNDAGKDNVGACCSGRSDKYGNCIGTCRTRFRVCLKHYQAKIDHTSPCTFGDVVTPVLGDNSVNLTGRSTEQLGFINPIRFPFDFTWPGTFTLIIEAWHDTNETSSRSPGVLISRLSVQTLLEVSPKWTENESAQSTVQYDFRVTCDAHYYGTGCANLCRPRDDQFGHYTCSASGDRVCLSGWHGDYCSNPRCLPGCNEQHGHCNKPNECICSQGYKGETCDECEPYPGCVHGTCQKPWECHCNEGWGGLFCNQDLNYCTNHRPCQNDGTCFNTGQGSYTCQCAPGYTGTDCDVVISDCANAPCLNGGTCVEESTSSSSYTRDSYRCECRKGWMGKYCEAKTIVCADKPCQHGTCLDSATGFKCTCPGGYSGINCDVQVDECNPNPCENSGTCINRGNSFKCICPSGFAGQRCQENIDDCIGNVCANGGTCVDMVNQFRCQCVPGYIGTLCASKVDLCLTKPCANGGSCINLNNDYRCVCRPGFTSKDCSVDIDECISQPCKNGGTCVNRVNSFQCVCPGGFRGSQCDEEAYAAANFDAMQISTSTQQEAQSGRSDGLSGTQIILIAVLSVATPVIALIAACVVICMKKKRKRAQEKDDAEARKQNEQNASANLHHGNSILSSKRSSSSGLTFDNTNPTIIKNTWDKSCNNMSSSASVDECLMNTSLYGGMSNYSDNTTSDCYAQQIQPLQRARSQKQLNTDPLVMHRASQIITSKEYLLDHKRISTMVNSGAAAAAVAAAAAADVSYCSNSNQRWQSPPTSTQQTQRQCVPFGAQSPM